MRGESWTSSPKPIRYGAQNSALVLRERLLLLLQTRDLVGEGQDVQSRLLILVDRRNQSVRQLLADSVALRLVSGSYAHLQQCEERKYQRRSRHAIQHRNVHLLHSTRKASSASQLLRDELRRLLLSRRLDLEAIFCSQNANLGQIRRINLNRTFVQDHCVQILKSHLFVTKLNSRHCCKIFCRPPPMWLKQTSQTTRFSGASFQSAPPPRLPPPCPRLPRTPPW